MTMLAEGAVTIDRELMVETDDRYEAARAFVREYGTLPECVTDGAVYHEVIGACEGCGRPIFEDEEAVRWADGILTCSDICPEPNP